jgi:hypothetical protein
MKENAMHDRGFRFRAACLAAGAACLAATAAALDPQQFAAGWPIEVPSTAEVFDVPLTAEVYAAAESLDEVAVLDANGAPLSFFRRGPPAPAAVERRIVLEASPLYSTGSPPGPTVGVTTSASGTSVTVTSSAPAGPAVVGFVLDARAVTIAPTSLELDWRALPRPFLADVRVEQSTNLTDWRAVGGASVAALEIGGAEVRHARVPVRAAAGGYYRVTADGAAGEWYLQRAVLVNGETPAAMPLTLRAQPLGASALPPEALEEALYFDVGGSVPAATMTLAFASDAGWLRADVAASDTLAGPWLPIVQSDLFYALTYEGRAFANPPVAVGRRELRYWRVLAAAAPRAAVELELTFPQEYLRVGASGAGPFLLAAGTLAEEAGPDPTFAAVWAELDPAPNVPLARLGARRDLGGPGSRPPPPFPWRTTVLWAVLVGGALVVGGMAVRLAREMQRKSP